MQALANAGIYLAVDVNTPFYSLNRLNSDSVRMSYNDVYLQSVFATVDMFSQYDNTLLFFSGNEVINDDTTTFAAPYVKAVTRDVRAYIQARNYRAIPVGYSAADVDSNRYQMATYMNCGPDAVRSDFFAFNDYSWCDPSSFQKSGWDQKVKQYNNYSIPLFLSEYGCNTNTRKFEEVASLYSVDMTGVYSGGLVYEYSQEGNNYGLVDISGSNVNERDDFGALQQAYQNTPNPSGDGGYKSSGGASVCPPASSTWNVTNSDLPVMPANAQKYFTSGAGSGPGNKGNTGSQTAGTPSTGFASDTTTSGSGSSSSHKSAAASFKPMSVSGTPFVAGFVVIAASMVSGLLL
jgi:1,3-beta-glucanosyltransferase GAS5